MCVSILFIFSYKHGVMDRTERKDWMFSSSNDGKLDLSAAVITETRTWRLEDFKEFKGSFTDNPPAYQTSENQTLDLSITESTYAHHSIYTHVLRQN